MKFCLNWRQPEDILRQATEIFIPYKDINIITDIIEDYPTKRILVILDNEREIDWNFLKACSGKAKISCECVDLEQMLICKQHKLNFHWSQSIQSFYELHQLIEFGIDSAYIGPELFFHQNILKNMNIELRLIPNVVNNNAFRTDSGIHGTWIRPEDIEYYNDAMIHFFIQTDDSPLVQERTLLLLYSQKRWLGDLNKIIFGIGVNCNNAVIDDDFGYQRLNCGNGCQKGRACHFCDRVITLAQAIKPS